MAILEKKRCARCGKLVPALWHLTVEAGITGSNATASLKHVAGVCKTCARDVVGFAWSDPERDEAEREEWRKRIESVCSAGGGK